MLPREQVLELNAIARDWFRDQLAASADARDYLAKRGISPETADAWQLGYAPAGRDHLIRHLDRLGWPATSLLSAGLVADNHEGSVYDKFRERLMFPLLDAEGTVLAFAGRTLIRDAGDTIPKYLNSPETSAFSKRKELYGWPNLDAIGQHHEAIVVEGHVDMLAMWQAGYRNVVGLGGVALTPDHLARLSERARRLVLVLDSDAAGRRAAIKALTDPATAAYRVEVVTLTGGKDPADLVSADPGAMRAALFASRSRIGYLWSAHLDEHGGSVPADIEQKIAWKNGWLKLARETAKTQGEVTELMIPLSNALGLPRGMLVGEVIGDRRMPA